jgi:hypothetical protein
MRIADPSGRRVVRSPATHTPIGDPSSDVNVADVIRGSPGRNVHPVIQPLATRNVIEVPAGWTSAPSATVCPATGRSVAVPSTHVTIRSSSYGVNVGSLLKAPYPRAACQIGIRRERDDSLIFRAQGSTSS